MSPSPQNHILKPFLPLTVVPKNSLGLASPKFYINTKICYCIWLAFW